MMEPNRLIRVMLVDDEEKTRNLLKLLVDWEALGFLVVGEASSGQEGLHMLEEIQPDLIFTDIKMPFMDGLEFAKLVRQQFPCIKIILLSAYEDFGYARQSIQIGISDYLLKPLKREKLRSTLQEIKDKVESESDVRQEYDRMKEQLTVYRGMMQDRFLNELILTDKAGVELEQKISYFSIQNIKKHVQVAVAACRPESPELSGEKKIIYDMVSLDLAKQYFQKNEKVYVFADQMENIVIANTDAALPFESACEGLKNIICAKVFRNVNVGIGTTCTGVNGLSKSYREACEALKYGIIYGDKIVLHYRDISVTESGAAKEKSRMDDIGFYVRAGLREETKEAIHRRLEQQPLEEIEDRNAVKVNGINLITLLINIAFDMKLPFARDEFTMLYADMIATNNIVQMESSLAAFADKLVTSVQNARRKKNSRLVDSVIQYIDEHMADPALGLSSLSAYFYSNPSYLSRTFKQQVGYTVVEYLTMQRIEAAKSLMQVGNKMAYEIGEAVGIPEPNYFGKCFKKYAGCSIQEYRKKIGISV